jgi:hypothetical protein
VEGFGLARSKKRADPVQKAKAHTTTSGTRESRALQSGEAKVDTSSFRIAESAVPGSSSQSERKDQTQIRSTSQPSIDYTDMFAPAKAYAHRYETSPVVRSLLTSNKVYAARLRHPPLVPVAPGSIRRAQLVPRSVSRRSRRSRSVITNTGLSFAMPGCRLPHRVAHLNGNASSHSKLRSLGPYRGSLTLGVFARAPEARSQRRPLHTFDDTR